jgi:hypothetical protein
MGTILASVIDAAQKEHSKYPKITSMSISGPCPKGLLLARYTKGLPFLDKVVDI